jgi:hypothetical protein
MSLERPEEAGLSKVENDRLHALSRVSGFEDSRALLKDAEALGIPWRAILLGEIRAERILQAYLTNSASDWPLSFACVLMPQSLLDSWRVRARIAALSWRSRLEDSREARKLLKLFHRHLSGGAYAPRDLTRIHLWSAYYRVLELVEIGRTAKRASGGKEERVTFVRRSAACSMPDAEWAVVRNGHLLDDAMVRAREEGFEIPAVDCEPGAFLRLRETVRQWSGRAVAPVRRRDFKSSASSTPRTAGDPRPAIPSPEAPAAAPSSGCRRR